MNAFAAAFVALPHVAHARAPDDAPVDDDDIFGDAGLVLGDGHGGEAADAAAGDIVGDVVVADHGPGEDDHGAADVAEPLARGPIDAAGLVAAFGQLPLAHGQGGGSRAFAGALRRSSAKTALMRAAKRAMQKRKDDEVMKDRYSRLADGWDSMVVRDGDRAYRDGRKMENHPNTIGPDVVVREAFKYIGLKFQASSGVLGTTHRPTMASCVCSVADAAQASRAKQMFPQLGCVSFVIGRYYDCTPLKLKFGSLAKDLAPSARYMVPADSGDRQRGSTKQWRAVRLDEYMQCKHRRQGNLPQYGVVEVMAQSRTLSFTNSVGHTVHHDWLIPPMFCGRSDASTLYAAVELGAPELSLQRICDYALQVRFGIVTESPDMLSANIRVQRAFAAKLPQNVLFFSGALARRMLRTGSSPRARRSRN